MKKLVCDKCSSDEFEQYITLDCWPPIYVVSCKNCHKRFEYRDPWHITEEGMVVLEEADERIHKTVS